MDSIKKIVLVAVALWLVACAPISEPWVQGNQLSDERDRSADAMKHLRDRLAASQIDR